MAFQISDHHAPVVYPNYAWQVKTERIFAFPESLDPVTITKFLETTQQWVTFPGRAQISFPMTTIRPKVQKIRVVEPKELPRDVETERKRKVYASINFEELLTECGIDQTKLYPIEILQKLFPANYTSENILNQDFFLPLEWFDNSDYDIYTENGWLNLGYFDSIQHPLPAFALVPNIGYKVDPSKTSTVIPALQSDHIFELYDVLIQNFSAAELLQNKNKLFVWRIVAVHRYDEITDTWILSDLETLKTYQLPRIAFKFVAEDPLVYAARLKNALSMRDNYEQIIKFQTVLDALLLLSTLREHDSKLTKRIYKIANYQYYHDKIHEDYKMKLDQQINLNYQRVMIKYEFEDFLTKHPKDFPFLSIVKVERIENIEYLQHPDIDIRELIRLLQFNTLYYIPATVRAMSKVAGECLNVEQMFLFQCGASKPVTLSEFKSTQEYSCNQVVKFLKGFWIDNLASQISIILRGVGKGWVDLTTNNWSVFKLMKMSRFLAQVKLRMEASLRKFLENSMNCYTNILCVPCHGLMVVPDQDYEWTETFLKCPFEQCGPPIFYLIIHLNADGPYYSTLPEEFLPIILSVYHSSLVQTTVIPLVDDQVMLKLVYARNLYLDCGEDIEQMFHLKKDYLQKSYEKAVIPLHAYCRKFNEFIPLYVLVIPEFIKEVREANLTAQQIKELIIQHKSLKQQLKEMLPLTMTIGPFFINVGPLKEFLVQKRSKIIGALLEYFVERMRDITEDLLEQFQEIYARLIEKSMSIEHIYALKDFMLTVPSLIEVLDEKVKIMMLEYDILDYFFYNLTNEQFARKWEVFGYAHKIFVQTLETNEQHKIDIDLFKKTHINELSTFQDRLESINEEVSQFSYNFDPEKAQETSVDAKKLWKTISEMLKLGSVLQSRQVLFDLDELSLDFVEQIVRSFLPYYELWTNGVNFLKLEELCMGNALSTIDVADIRSQLTNYINLLNISKDIFNEKPEIQNVADYFLKQIDNFLPYVDVMDYVRHENWLPIHWVEFAHKSKVDIKYSISINLHYCIRKGIMDHIDLVKQIYDRAIVEADSIRLAMEEEQRAIEEAERLAIERKKNRRCRRDVI